MAIQAQLFSDNLGFSLGNSHELLVENGCGFDNLGFAPQHQQQLVELESKNLSLLVDNNVRFHQSMAFSQTVSAHIERQRLEFEQFINFQNERLKMAMQEQRKQQIAVMIRKYEWKAELMLRQKEEEIGRASKRNAELQNFLKKIDVENQMWQRLANENEAVIASLNSSIQRLRESSAGDAESCCDNVEEDEEEEEERKGEMMCKCCNSRSCCVVMLPCRHLCSCKHCEVFLDSCPVCTMPKKATIEALI